MAEGFWINGEYRTREQATVSVLDHGLLYGDGVFEGLRSYGGRIFRLREHIDRLFASAHAIALAIPYDRETVMATCREVLERSGLADGYLRVVVTRGVGDLGLNPTSCREPQVIVIASTIQVYPRERLAEGLRLVTAATPVPHREALSPRIKSLNYLPHVLAKLEALNAKVDEVLMMNATGSVAEASGQNLFVVHEGTLLTPPVYEGILRGVTRDALLEVAVDAGIPATERPLNRYDVYNADEAFLCGTASEVVPIRSLDGREVGAAWPGPVTSRLMEGFERMVATER